MNLQIVKFYTISRPHIAIKKGAFAEESSMESKKKAIELVDKAVTKGILHKNNAARKKSAIAKMMKS